MAAETIAHAVSEIRKTFPNMNSLNEQDVKKFVVERILTALDWNLFNPKEFKPEYRVGDGRADFALNPESPSIAVFIEVKKPAVNLENAKHPGQLLRYCFDQTVNLGVLTNGRTWWLYLPRYEGPQREGLKWAEKRFCEIDIANGGPKAIQTQFEKFLTKEKVSSGDAVESGKKIIDAELEKEKAKKGIVEAWNDLVAAPSEDLITLLNESTFQGCGVKPGKPEVKKFFQQHRAQFKVSGVGHPQPKPSTNGRGSTQNGKPAFTFLEVKYSVGDWKQVLLKLCVLIYDRHPAEFDRIQKIRKGDKLYFSSNSNDLGDVDPEPIGNSGIFAATAAIGPARVNERCRMVLQEFGYPEDCFRIE